MGFFKAVVNVVKAVIKAVTTSVAAIGKAVSSGNAKDIKNAVDTIEKGINDIENANKELEKEMKKKLKITTGAEDSGIIPTWEDIKKGWNNNMLMGKDPGIIIKCTKSFFKGLVYDTGKSALEGIGNMFMHPIKTAEGIANALSHPIDTGAAIGKEIGNAFNKEVINGDASSRAHFAGRVLGEVALAVFGPKGVDKVTKIAKGSEYAAEAANALNKIKNISVNSEKLSQAVGRLNSVINKADELVEASTGFRISNVVEEYGKVGIQTIEKNETQIKYMEAVEDAVKGAGDPELKSSESLSNKNINNDRVEVKDGKRNTRSENSLRRKLENRIDAQGNKMYTEEEIKAIMDIRNSEYELTLENSEKIIIKRHGYQKNDATGQSHHLNQDAAYREIIPTEEGLAIDADGNVFMEPESSHYKAHETMEEFWDDYRVGGEMDGIKPTVGEYNSALKDSMVNAGFSEADADLITEIAASQQRAYGLTEAAEVPRIPGRINAIER
ncbi:hypothetical protein I6U48_23795 [Clostridium sp. PL3]|uniref:Uncharacterized protein n=1 Tax=Clostridium thailandense TaxID=2794346 RepID=A0A949TYF8_9CLOT|nr:hypothetical protein [Clostridium thailandense]MBV7275921.1 hypothetical protein [Clostridium thailandense]